MIAHHNPDARAEAAALTPITRADLAGAAGGEKLGGGVWVRVQGPHMRAVRRTYKRNHTGCPGISLSTSRSRRADGSFRTRHYYYVNLGKTHRKFCLESIGREEAWRRAVRLRAEHERRITAINAAILEARQQAKGAA